MVGRHLADGQYANFKFTILFYIVVIYDNLIAEH